MQLVGFLIMMFGTFTYYEVIRLPCLPESWYAKAAQPSAAAPASRGSRKQKGKRSEVYEDDGDDDGEDAAAETARCV